MKFSPNISVVLGLSLSLGACAAQSDKSSDDLGTGMTSGEGTTTGTTSGGTTTGTMTGTTGGGTTTGTTTGDGTTTGTTSGGTTTGTGTPEPSDCAVIDPNDMLSDFEGGEAKLSEVSGRAGSWYMSDDGSGTATPVKIPDTPLSAESGGACDSAYAFHTVGSGFSGWGALAAVDLVPKVGDVKQSYDASAYSGLSFRAKAGGSVQVRVEIATVDSMAEGGVCNPDAVSGDPDRCGDHFGMNVVLSTEWNDVNIPFAQMTQKGWGMAAAGLDASAAYSVRFKVEGGDFDYTIDDVHFTK